MILVTGGTGFVGKVLINNLIENGYSVRTLIRPSPQSPELPRGVPVEVAVSSLSDVRGLRAAMVGIDTVYHLAGAEWRGARADLMKTDVQGTQAVVEAARDAGVKRIFFVSHLGADRASAYPAFKAKAISEEFIRRSGVDYTILRSAILYGKNDRFTNGLARLLHTFPLFFFIPSDGEVLLQPLWVEDLVTCLTWSLEDTTTINQTLEIGGPEYLKFSKIVDMVMDKTHSYRKTISLHPPYMRTLTVLLETIFPGLPVSVYWIDYLAANRTCSLDTIPRQFGLLPARMSHHIDYLQNIHFGSRIKTLFKRAR
jgi:NADH dehydrogenase